MCGIVGGVSTDRPDPGLVRRMCDVIVHRGPDDAGYHSDGHAALGMRRLAIIDVAGGAQPVYSEDATVVAVFNGELYNFGELRTQLRAKGHRFTTDGDSECLVHLYEEHGEDLVDHLRGMFAFAIWDARRGRLLLARDRAGKKPLYWRTDGETLWFASELKALAQDASMSRDLDLLALHDYLTYQYVPAPRSIYAGVHKLPPGHLLTWQDGTTTLRRYWRVDFTTREVVDEREAEEQLRELLLEATRIRMISERPLGAFLSGGIDSSAVVAAMAQQSSKPVRTFSIGFDDSRFDERAHARAVAERYGTEHHEFVVTQSALDVLPTLAWHFDEPFADSSAIPTFYVAQLSREHVTVVLTGDGADESFGGYRRYAAMAGAPRLRVPGAAGHALARMGSTLASRSPERSRRRDAGRVLQLLGQPVNRRYAQLVSYFEPAQKDALYTDALRDQLSAVDSYGLLDEAYAASNADSDAGRFMDVDINTYLPGDILAKVDITTMANSLEARSPFLDHHIMEWAAALPTSLKVHRGRTKHLLKNAVAPWLPPQLIDRPKAGFGVPLATWLRTELRDLTHDTLTDDTARGRGLFRPEAVTAMLREHDNGHDHASRIWTLLQLELWHRRHVDASATSGVTHFQVI